MIVISIGSNLSFGALTPEALCRAAFARLSRLPELNGEGVAGRLSRLYATRPIPDDGQPEYVNAVACVRLAPRSVGAVEPARLLDHLMEIEASFGRVRGAVNAGRTLDLDLIAIGGMVRHAPDPVLPHPRCGERRFVLEPLEQLVPDWRHPVSGESVAALLARLPDQGVRPLA